VATSVVFVCISYAARSEENKKLTANRQERLEIAQLCSAYAQGEVSVTRSLYDPAKGHFYASVEAGDSAALASTGVSAIKKIQSDEEEDGPLVSAAEPKTGTGPVRDRQRIAHWPKKN
jgi:hypothetical protein